MGVNRGVIVFILSITTADGVLAQQPRVPAGNWQSARRDVFTSPLHPVVTRAELYLNIDVANDGSFRGHWGEYACSPSIGAYGYQTFSCGSSGSSGRVSGQFDRTGQGVIELEKLGRSGFNWSTPSVNELSIDLPRNWQGGEAVFHRARMTRDGKPRPASPKPDDGPLLSAPALYREFLKNETATVARYKGRTLELEGRRGTLIQMSGGGAAIHVPDGYQPRALVLLFRNLNEVSGISEGATFRFRCTVDDWAYQYVHLNDCSILR
jgi:hypothetical protein